MEQAIVQLAITVWGRVPYNFRHRGSKLKWMMIVVLGEYNERGVHIIWK